MLLRFGGIGLLTTGWDASFIGGWALVVVALFDTALITTVFLVVTHTPLLFIFLPGTFAFMPNARLFLADVLVVVTELSLAMGLDFVSITLEIRLSLEDWVVVTLLFAGTVFC